jgi:hypothetical protein
MKEVRAECAGLYRCCAVMVCDGIWRGEARDDGQQSTRSERKSERESQYNVLSSAFRCTMRTLNTFNTEFEDYGLH